MSIRIKIGTRGSPLALAQAKDVKQRLINTHDELTSEGVEIVVIKTTGDRILDRHLMSAGGKGLFTKEIEEALLSGDIDCAVHSCKDMPTQLPDGLTLSTFLPREDNRDVFISPVAKSLNDLPEGSLLGTASLRRRALALRQRPDLKVVTFRGNVQSRLRKLEAGEAAATFLALAGLNRMEMADVATERLDLERFPPAPAQGAVTIEIRDDDQKMHSFLAPLHCSITTEQVTAERSFLAALDGSCRTPIAAYAIQEGADLVLRGMLLSLDGQTVFERSMRRPREQAEELGTAVGEAIKEDAGAAFFDQLKQDIEAAIE
ncbi:hydroxymethylbilane synthase [Temperatibacter marinus]|uniref:Porphobilinogen deaminase n=1 Tax=Temperatibacter marinus TaxID=1456591 RepID=A0AA52EFC8_9PROT|nr:hydroxymethylbilane synthase [Temperatibacter marinus]WND03751.1 hydroxymethylbilane synthase [Temperatibacter marinus]